ncbi:MAG: EutN/CcmL family microcompartment protein [Actinobacteria bacterium]|nr:EutN/CcmL family microcompartment protein [Actinomycetota bacterium]MCG2790110.1 EutN/CcmL family microcompartment protein [Actinomycetes bacterium]
MKMVKVIGSVTSTIKDDCLKGVKLLFVQAVDIDLTERNDFYIAIDTVGLGEGELGLMVIGSTAKLTDITKGRNVDAALVAKVERIDLKNINHIV